jgi:adenosine deaminase
LDLSQLPKIELHLHLDYSLSYEVVSQIDASITYDAYRETFIAPPKCVNLADCLTRAAAGVALMQTKEQLRSVTADLFEQLQRDNVIYAEIATRIIQSASYIGWGSR